MPNAWNPRSLISVAERLGSLARGLRGLQRNVPIVHTTPALLEGVEVCEYLADLLAHSSADDAPAIAQHTLTALTRLPQGLDGVSDMLRAIAMLATDALREKALPQGVRGQEIVGYLNLLSSLESTILGALESRDRHRA